MLNKLLKLKKRRWQLVDQEGINTLSIRQKKEKKLSHIMVKKIFH